MAVQRKQTKADPEVPRPSQRSARRSFRRRLSAQIGFLTSPRGLGKFEATMESRDFEMLESESEHQQNELVSCLVGKLEDAMQIIMVNGERGQGVFRLVEGLRNLFMSALSRTDQRMDRLDAKLEEMQRETENAQAENRRLRERLQALEKRTMVLEKRELERSVHKKPPLHPHNGNAAKRPSDFPTSPHRRRRYI